MPSLLQAVQNWAATRQRSRGRGSHAGAVPNPSLDAAPYPPLPSDAGAYSLGPVLGRGTTSIVHAATCATHPHLALAIKRIDLDRAGGDLDLVIREVRLLGSTRSPHLAPLWAAFSGGAAGHELWLVQPRAVCSVRDVLDAHCEPGHGLADHRAAAAVTKAVAAGLAALHAAGAAHRDVKASNVLLFTSADGQGLFARLADLGTAGVGAGGLAAAPSADPYTPTPAARAARGRALALGASLWRLVPGWPGKAAAGAAEVPAPDPTPAAPAHGIASPFAGGGSGNGRDAPPKPPPHVAAADPRPRPPKDLPSYRTFVGSPAWMAPEVFNLAAAEAAGGEDAYSTAADLFSLACLVCELGEGAPPGAAMPFPVLAMSRLHGPAPELHRCDWPAEAGALVAACGVREPGDRPTAAAVLASPWLQGDRVEVEGGRVLAGLVAGGAPPLSDGTAHRGAPLTQPSRSETILAPFRARVAPPSRSSHARGVGVPGSLASPDPAGAAAATLLDATAVRRILRSALLPAGLAARAGSLGPLLAAALPAGAPTPNPVAALGSATAIAVFGRDHCAGRALGRFHYRLGVAFLRVPLPAPGDPAADAAYEACPGDDKASTAWAGPILFFLGRRRNALPGSLHPTCPGIEGEAGAPLVLVMRAANNARALATLLGSTATGGRLLGEVVQRNPLTAPPAAGPPGLPRAVWLYPSPAGGDPAVWPTSSPWTALNHRSAGAAWLHAAADLTAAAHRSRGGGGRGGGGGDITPGDVLSGRLGPPSGWQGVVADLVEVRGWCGRA